MIKTQRLVQRSDYNPAFHSSPMTFETKISDRALEVGDVVLFSCNGNGRGGHFRVTAKVTKVNRKTFKATELPRSYRPGTLWSVSYESDGDIYIDLDRTANEQI